MGVLGPSKSIRKGLTHLLATESVALALTTGSRAARDRYCRRLFILLMVLLYHRTARDWQLESEASHRFRMGGMKTRKIYETRTQAHITRNLSHEHGTAKKAGSVGNETGIGDGFMDLSIAEPRLLAARGGRRYPEGLHVCLAVGEEGLRVATCSRNAELMRRRG
jgi:hypothetical protein